MWPRAWWLEHAFHEAWPIRRWHLFAGTVAYYTAVASYEATARMPTLAQRRKTMDGQARTYDTEADPSRVTKSSGGQKAESDLRQALLVHASGRVLEVSAGTGRNLAHFEQPRISSLVLGDVSEPLLQVAALKVAKRRAEHNDQLDNVTLAICDSEALPFPDGSFDTVIDTFGLCSCESPGTALREMTRCCRPGGQVLLLERGCSTWLPPLRLWQRTCRRRDAWDFGSVLDRDFTAIVAAESDLEVMEGRHEKLGTISLLRCHKRVADTTVLAAPDRPKT